MAESLEPVLNNAAATTSIVTDSEMSGMNKRQVSTDFIIRIAYTNHRIQ